MADEEELAHHERKEELIINISPKRPINHDDSSWSTN